MKDDRTYLEHIRDAIASIESFTQAGEDGFKQSDLIQSGVLYKLQTLAETTQRLSNAARLAHAEVNWVGIRGFRNRLVHDYLAINLDLVWQVVVRDLPILKHAVVEELAKLDASPDRQ